MASSAETAPYLPPRPTAPTALRYDTEYPLIGTDQGSQYARIPAADRAAALEILTTTQPAFAAIRKAAMAASPPAG